MTPRDQWLAKLSRLNIDRSRGPAPHKPLLLLAVLARLDEGEVLPAVQPLSPELAFRFQTLWAVVAHRRPQRPDVRMPFHHLESDSVWSPLLADGTPSPHRGQTRMAAVAPDFAAFAADPANRRDAERVLVRTYFTPAEQVALAELVGLTAGDIEPGDTGVDSALIEDVVRRGREARFRLRVVAAYEYTCALTGYRLTTVDGATIVDAAHIHRFADSGNNDPRNGLALCKNAHWMFDEGLWTLADDLTVDVAADAFAEAGPVGLRLAPYHGLRLAHLPRDPANWPDPVHLGWHRRNVHAAG